MGVSFQTKIPQSQGKLVRKERKNMDQTFFIKLETEVFNAKKVDGVLITSPANMRKCSGFRGEGIIYVSKELKLVFTDSRYVEAAKEECPEFEILLLKESLYETFISQIVGRAGQERAANFSIGFEDEWMTVRDERTIRALLKKYDIPGMKLVPLHKSLDRLRQIKSGHEIQEIERAEHIGDEAFEMIVRDLAKMRESRCFLTEKQVAARLEFFMRESGAEGTSFDTIAASGIHSSMPHAIPTDRVLAEGDFLTMDFGCRVNGYCSDMTRTVVIGHAGERQKEVYDIVLRAQLAAIKAVRPGVKCCEIDRVARSVIEEAGYGEQFGHALGHSVGLMIHETPCFSKKDQTILEPGMVITVEPGIYMEGDFGVRIEDVVVITEDGCRNITRSPKALIEM